MHSIKIGFAFLMILPVLCVSMPGHAQSHMMDFFAHPDRSVATGQRLKLQDIPQSVGRTEVSINPDIFDSKPGDELVLTLPGYETQLVVFDRMMQHGSGNVTWVGHLQANSAYRVMLTGSGSVFLGGIATPESTFSIRYENGRTILLDYEAAGLQQLPFYDDAKIPPEPLSKGTGVVPEKYQAPPMLAAGPAVIDVLILYSPGIAIDFPGATLQIEIDRLTAIANQAYADSSITTTLRIVKVEATSYADTGNNSVALDALTGNTGDFSGVSALRASVGADLVILLRKFASDSVSCGIAWTFQPSHLSNPSWFGDSYAYGVVSLGSVGGLFCTDAAYPHEIGHLMGSNHDWLNSSRGGAYTYALGHYGVNFGTIMSYVKPRFMYFSNPGLILCGGPVEACGIAVGLTGEADNRTAFNVTNPLIAALRAPTDPDGDGLFGVDDNCPDDSNGGQLDTDSDGDGDVCDTDDDDDGVLDVNDAFPLIDLGGLTDTDGDGAPNECDAACQSAGMSADTDDDGDSFPDVSDNCPVNSNAEQLDTDTDGTGDVCDSDTTPTLITSYYDTILGRLIDAGGLAYWESEMARLTGLGMDSKEGFITLAKLFFNSTEYLGFGKSNADFVTDLYLTFFTRTPLQTEIDFWADEIVGGVSRNTIMNFFVFSTEFDAYMQARFGPVDARPENNMVNDFYRGLLSRQGDDSGYNYWLGEIRTAQCSADAAGISSIAYQVASLFTTSQEYTDRIRDHAGFIEDIYDGIMRRQGDAGGFIYWVNELVAGNRTRDEVLQAFAASPEFQTRVTAVVNAGCVP